MIELCAVLRGVMHVVAALPAKRNAVAERSVDGVRPGAERRHRRARDERPVRRLDAPTPIRLLRKAARVSGKKLAAA